MQDERILPLADCDQPIGAYFAMVLIPGEGRRCERLACRGRHRAGQGRADDAATLAALARATDLVGYGPYLDRHSRDASRPAPACVGQSGRARAGAPCPSLAAAGREVVVVSGGDPGVFAMRRRSSKRSRPAIPDGARWI